MLATLQIEYLILMDQILEIPTTMLAYQIQEKGGPFSLT